MSEEFAPSRRELVIGGAVVAAAMAPASSSLVQRGTASSVLAGEFANARPFAQQDLADWQKQVGWRFAIADETGAAPMKLIAVKPGKAQPAGHLRANNFTAVFEMDAESAPEGGRLYDVRHASLGSTQLYLERTTVDAGRARMRASFS